MELAIKKAFGVCVYLEKVKFLVLLLILCLPGILAELLLGGALLQNIVLPPTRHYFQLFR